MSLVSQAEQVGTEMIKDPASYVAAAAASAPMWLADFNTWMVTLTALAGFIYLISKIWGVWLQNKGLSLDNEKKRRDAED